MKRLIFILAACVSTIATLQAQQAEPVTINGTNYSTYLERITETRPENSSYGQLTQRFVAKEALRNVEKIIIASTLPADYRYFYHNHGAEHNGGNSTVLANLKEIVLEAGHPITMLDLRGTMIERAEVQNPRSGRTFNHFNIQSSRLKQENITLSGDRVSLAQLHLHRGMITDLSPFYSKMNATAFTGLYCNGGKYYRKSYAGVDDGTFNPTNQIREIDMKKIPSSTTSLQLSYNLLEHMENFEHPISNLQINNNLLWSLDLDHLTVNPTSPSTINYTISPQKPMADLWVEKGVPDDGSGDEVRIYIPPAQAEVFIDGRLIDKSVKFISRDGKLHSLPDQNQTIFEDAKGKYFKLVAADTINTDLDYYGVHDGFTYKYNTRPHLGNEYGEKRDMEVQVKIYPYIMYINPKTMSGSGVDYYSGTLWLDYHSIVPEGTTVWIATGIKRDSMDVGSAQAENQLVLEPIGGPGDVIPAGTAMYVRSKTKAGLYAFQKAWTPEYLGWGGPSNFTTGTDTVMYNEDLSRVQAQLAQQIEKIGNRNILVGSGEDTTVDAYSTLTLGRESKKGTRMIGFWPYTGTKIAAHRCYIKEAKYKELVEGLTPSPGAAKGVTFYFEELPETTGIHSIDNGQRTIADDAWYSIDGKRLNAKPTQKGLYIHNGRKEAVL